MSTPKDIQILKTVAAVKVAIELGNATDATAEVAKLVAMVSTGIAVESVLRVYTGLNGLGLALSEWRLGRAVSGNEVDITRTAFVAGQVAAQIVGGGIDWAREWNIGGQLYELLHQHGSPELIAPSISSALSTRPDPLVKTISIRYADPLVLDLDGDGLEITPLSGGVLFDANGDTIKTATAWVGADDGQVVRDLNGNGLIDSGREQFGDETILTTGARVGQKAFNGFDALADLDKDANGVADGKFDAGDAQYANLRIWRDLNQDGISQSNELKTLAASGVQSIKLTTTPSTQQYGDAMLVQNGTFTRVDADGATTLGQAGSFVLAQNNSRTEFVPIAVSAAAKALPAISGSGWVRGLQEVNKLLCSLKKRRQGSKRMRISMVSTRMYVQPYKPVASRLCRVISTYSEEY